MHTHQTWQNEPLQYGQSRRAIPMSWYYGNRNPLGGSAFKRGKGGRLAPAQGPGRAAREAYRAGRSRQRFEQTVRRLGY
jgi:hypothetical protein